MKGVTSPAIIIVVSGAIGVGKSTLLDVLKDIGGYDVLAEPVDMWREQGWLQEFYEDQRGKAFWFQQAVYESSIENVERKLKEIKSTLKLDTFAHAISPHYQIAYAFPAITRICRECDENHFNSTNKTGRLRPVLFVERYIYDQLCFWQTNLCMGNGSKAEDDVYMRFWQRWRHFIPEPDGYLLLRGDTHVEERGRREEITASKDESFARYQAKLEEMHCRFFTEPMAEPERIADETRVNLWGKEGKSVELNCRSIKIPCLHLKVSDFAYHNNDDAKRDVVAHIEQWMNTLQ